MRPSFPIRELVPHADEMLLLDAVEEFEADHLVGLYVVPAQGLFTRDDGRLPAWVGVEIMAQAIAAHVGVRCRLSGAPIPIGVLVGARRLHSSVDAFEPGARLSVDVRRVMEDGKGVGIWSCRLDGDGVRSEAQLSVYEPPDAAEFFERGA